VECHVLEDADSEQTQKQMKESEDPEPTRTSKIISGRLSDVRKRVRSQD